MRCWPANFRDPSNPRPPGARGVGQLATTCPYKGERPPRRAAALLSRLLWKDNDHPQVVAVSPSNFGVAGKREDTDCVVCLTSHEGRVEILPVGIKILRRQAADSAPCPAAPYLA